MKELTIINALNLIMENKLSTDQLYFWVEDVGYVQVTAIYFYTGGINVHNHEIDIDTDFAFTDKIFVIK